MSFYQLICKEFAESNTPEELWEKIEKALIENAHLIDKDEK